MLISTLSGPIVLVLTECHVLYKQKQILGLKWRVIRKYCYSHRWLQTKAHQGSCLGMDRLNYGSLSSSLASVVILLFLARFSCPSECSALQLPRVNKRKQQLSLLCVVVYLNALSLGGWSRHWTLLVHVQCYCLQLA